MAFGDHDGSPAPSPAEEIPPLPASAETGALGVMHLKRFWARTAWQRATGRQAVDAGEFTLDRIALFGVNAGLLEGLKFLAEGASFDAFERWILDINDGALEPGAAERINDAIARRGGAPGDARLVPAMPAPVFGPAELAAWDRDGYVVLHDAIDASLGAAAVRAVWQSLGASPDDPGGWYGGPQGHSIWLPLIHHPVLQAIRRAPRIRAAFAQLWGSNDLWATVDRAGFNPPERPGWRFPGPHLHWDSSVAPPMPFGVQGILYLTDTAAEQGAFTCVPGFHKRLDGWLASRPPGVDPRQPDPALIGSAMPIPGRAGDLVIWHHALPHGSRPNRTDRPRLVHYLTMFPTDHCDDRPWI